MDERVRSDVEMENKFYKRFQPGIMFSGNPFWNSLPGLRAPPAALRCSLFFFFKPILVSAIPSDDCSSPHTGCNHLKVESCGLIIFVYPIHSGFTIKVCQMSIITFALSHYKFLLDKKYTFMTLHRHSI